MLFYKHNKSTPSTRAKGYMCGHSTRQSSSTSTRSTKPPPLMSSRAARLLEDRLRAKLSVADTAWLWGARLS
eukprot:6189065-Pleurochrysis_carterae.AAC.1